MRIVVALLVLAALVACTQVTSSVESFSRLSQADFGRTIAIVPNREQDVGSLQFADIAGRLRPRLAARGFKIVDEGESAELLAILDYDIGGPRTEVSTYPTSHTRTEYDYFTDTYVTVRVDGTDVSTRTLHDRSMTLQIVDPAAPASRGVLFEARVNSAGGCDRLSEVADEMFEALFRDFPNTTGRIDIPAQTDC